MARELKRIIKSVADNMSAKSELKGEILQTEIDFVKSKEGKILYATKHKMKIKSQTLKMSSDITEDVIDNHRTLSKLEPEVQEKVQKVIDDLNGVKTK